MNAARIWKLVTAVLIAAGLLAAVPAGSQALTLAPARSSVGSSPTGAAAAAPAGESAATGHALQATSLPAVIAGEAKCGCPPNNGEVMYVLKQLGIPYPGKKDAFIKLLGKVLGAALFATLVAALAKNAPKLLKAVPFPNVKAKSTTKYAKTAYRVYEIYGISVVPPEHARLTWKYGITRQKPPEGRPEPQVPACTKHFGPGRLRGGLCTYEWRWTGTGWFMARTWEAEYTMNYALKNGGACPPGMPACV